MSKDNPYNISGNSCDGLIQNGMTKADLLFEDQVFDLG